MEYIRKFSGPVFMFNLKEVRNTSALHNKIRAYRELIGVPPCVAVTGTWEIITRNQSTDKFFANAPVDVEIGLTRLYIREQQDKKGNRPRVPLLWAQAQEECELKDDRVIVLSHPDDR